MSGRIMALDYGEKRIGVAISDPLKLFAKPHSTIENLGFEAVLAKIKSLQNELNVEYLVVGLPYAISGDYTPKTIETLEFIQKLIPRLEIPVIRWDERYSSQEAQAELKKMGKSWQEARKVVDAMAAAMILKSYLEQNA